MHTAVTGDGAPKPYTAPNKQVWGWGVGRVAEFCLVAIPGQAINIFTVGFGLDPRLMSWCTMLPRLVDGIIDPIVGHWSDDTHTRWGRRKPFLLGGALLGSLLLAGLWWASPNWSATQQFIFLLLVGMSLYICYGMYVMAWNALGYELSDDYHERSKIQAVQGFFLAIMLLINSWIYWLALRPVFGGVIWGMRWIGGIAAVAVVISAIICVKFTKERFTHTNKTHVALLPAIKVAIRNRPFLVLVLMKIGEILGGRLVGGISFFLGVYYVCRGDLELSTRIAGIGATLGAVWNFAMLPLVKPASKWMGKRGALILGAAIGFGCALINPFVTTPEHPYWGMIPGLIVAPLLVLTGTITAAILPDICDLDELASGQRREGLFSSVMAFVSKLEISLAVVLTGYIVSWSSVDTKINQRWESVSQDAAAKSAVVFPVGEVAVFGFKDRQPATIAAVKIDADNLRELEIQVSDESPTTGFRSLGRFQPSGAVSEFTFAAVTPKFVRVELLSPQDEARPVALRQIGVGPAVNLLAKDQGGRLLAAQPPMKIQKRLFYMIVTMYIVFSGFTLLMALLFPLTEEKMKEVRLLLDERHLAQAEAGEPTDEVAEEFVHEHPAEAEKFVHDHPIPPESKDQPKA